MTTIDEKVMLVSRKEAEKLNGFLDGADCEKYRGKWTNIGEVRFDDGCRALLEVYCNNYRTVFKVRLMLLAKGHSWQISQNDLSMICDQTFTDHENHRVKVTLF